MKDNASRRRPFRRTLLATAAMLSLTALASTAQTPSPAGQDALAMMDVTTPVPYAANAPAPLPVQVERKPLANTFDVRLFEAIAQDLVANQRVPGLAMAIVHDGKVLSARGYGITDVQNAEPVDAHTVFRLASLSKPFAGTVTGMLVSEGALRWDSPLVDFMPSLRFAEPTAAERLTVADVLSHRVGLPRTTFDRDIQANADYRDLVARLSQVSMTCMPGDCYDYQNVAFSLIGDVVFAASGQFYNEAVTRRVLKPLGMNDSSLGLEGIMASPRWAKPHIRAGAGWRSVTPKPTYYRVSPAAGVNASISDMAQWLIAQGGHRPDVLPAPLLATLQAPIVGTPTELRGTSWRRERLNAAGYGLGWRVYDYAGHRMVFHGGAVQGYRGVMAMLPERDLGIVILWNSESGLPSGLLPTILDRAIGLPQQPWLEIDPAIESLFADASEPPPGPSSPSSAPVTGGAGASHAAATPH
jgi:beta-lactamase class C